MNPMYAETVQDAAIYGQLLFDGLSYIGADYLPHPRLATGWTHSPDGLHWDVDLRHDVRWSDGVPFTAKDVVFSYRTYLDPKVGYLDIGTIKYVKDVYAEGPYRVHFDLQHPSATFEGGVLGENLVPEHVLGKIAPDRQRFSSFGEHPVGTGPYMLQSWQHDSEAVFVRNPYNTWRRAKIARFDFRTIFNDQSELEALANGSADLIDDLSYTQYKQLQRIAPHVKLLTFPGLYIDLIELNMSKPGLDDIVVRQAMMYGYDRKAVVHGMFDDKVDVPDSYVPRALTHWHTDNVMQYPYEPKKAEAMLDAAGWKRGPDGVRRKGKVRLEFELLLNQGSSLITDEMLTWVADMRAIGIEINLRLTDFASLVARTYDPKGNYEITADARGGIVDPDVTSVFDSTQIPPNGANTTRTRDPYLDKLLHEGLVTLDDAKRRAVYDKVQAELAKQLPWLPQYGRFAGTAYAPRVLLDPKVTLQSPLGYYNVQDWGLAP